MSWGVLNCFDFFAFLLTTISQLANCKRGHGWLFLGLFIQVFLPHHHPSQLYICKEKICTLNTHKYNIYEHAQNCTVHSACAVHYYKTSNHRHETKHSLKPKSHAGFIMTNKYKPITVTCIRKGSYHKYYRQNTHLYKLLINTSLPLFIHGAQ